MADADRLWCLGCLSKFAHRLGGQIGDTEPSCARRATPPRSRGRRILARLGQSILERLLRQDDEEVGNCSDQDEVDGCGDRDVEVQAPPAADADLERGVI